MTAPLGPTIVVGAARSGTKIMRESLSRVLDIPAVPYDVGYVWRHGNESAADDHLTRADVKPRTQRLVTSFLGKYADKQGQVIEKTVGNTLRIPYVAELFPRARFVHLVRDGVDVTESARREWQRPSDLAYLRRKLRHVPWRVAPNYGRKFVIAQTVGRWRHGSHASTWGPRYRNIDRDLAESDLLTVCARQWQQCVVAARRDLAAQPQTVIQVRYEEFIRSPTAVLSRIADALGSAVDPAALHETTTAISSAGAGRGRSRLDEPERELLREELGATLEELGYEPV